MRIVDVIIIMKVSRCTVLTKIMISIQALYDNATAGLAGPVDYVHTCVDFGNVTLAVNGTKVKL